MDEHATTVLLGGAGTTGRRVAARLRDAGLPVRLASTSTPRRFDWTDRTTWAGALEGADAAYIAYIPDLAVPGAPEAIAELTDVALDAGVRRLVLLSGRGEEQAQRAEQALLTAAPGATVVRCAWFDQNFSEGHLLGPILSGELALPVSDVREPFLDAGDIADVVVAALTGGGHEGIVHELTGPRLLTFGEAVAGIATASGRPVRFTPVTMNEFAAGMAAEGVPGDVAWLMEHLFTEVLDGRNASVTDGVERALGRPARDFTAFARRAAADGAWTAVEAAR